MTLGARGTVGFADLVGVDEPPPGDGTGGIARRAAVASVVPSRRGVLKGLVGSAATLGIGALAVFPSARPAIAHHRATHVGYRVARGGCPSYAGSHNCAPGCGPSPVFGDVCVQSGAYKGWFKNDPARGYRLRPGVCLPGADAWKWRYQGRCGLCRRVIEYRCHDGYKRIGGGWYNAICRTVTECDGRDPAKPTTRSPVGQVLVFRRRGGSVKVRGWAIDPDKPNQKIKVRLRKGKVVLATRRADRPGRLPKLFRQFGGRHYFDFAVHLGSGTHRVTVEAMNVRRGQNTALATRTITIP